MSLAYGTASSQAFFQPAISLPREHLAAIQHILNDAMALQTRAPRPPPPPYNNNNNNSHRSDTIWFKPRMDMYESPSASGARPIVTATFELPGLRKEDVRIDVLDNHMIVAGDRRQLSPSASEDLARDEGMSSDEGPKPEEEPAQRSSPEHAHSECAAGYTVREIKRGRFKRVVPLPAGTKLEDVKAWMHDGILTVTFPGAVRSVPHSIPVA